MLSCDMQVAQALGMKLPGVKAPRKRKATPAQAAKPNQAMAPPPAQAASAQQTPDGQQAAMPTGKRQRQTAPRQPPLPGMLIAYMYTMPSLAALTAVEAMHWSAC